MEDRKKKEVEHSDHRRSIVRSFEYFTDDASDKKDIDHISDQLEYDTNFSNMKFYSISRSSFTHRDTLLFTNIEGKIALDYCCGNGEIAIEMALRGADRVVGIDISSVAIENARQLALDAGVADRCRFYVMDAEHTEFSDDNFDVIHEYGALHHLELSMAFAELSRILKPGGRLICTEAMRHNPLIHWYRTRTPHLRTEWEVEHILGVPEINRGKRYFRETHYRMFHLAVLAAVPFRKRSLFGKLLTVLERLDDLVLKIPYLNRMAWVSVIEYTQPRK